MKNIQYKKVENIGLLIISRPDHLNALNKVVLSELDKILDDFSKDQDLRCMIITGDGERAFVAGADINEMINMDKEQARQFSILGKSVMQKIQQFKIPIIAAVNGYAIGGGCELALSCDIIIASENAVFSQPEVSFGIIPGWGGTQRLPLRIGIGNAKSIIYTGEHIKASEALAIGLADRLVGKDELLKEAMELAKKIASKSRSTIIAAKKAINNTYFLDIEKGLEIETELFSDCFLSTDQKERMQAFLKNRK